MMMVEAPNIIVASVKQYDHYLIVGLCWKVLEQGQFNFSHARNQQYT